MFMRCKVTVDTSHYPKDVPWELPEGWCWCLLSDLASFAGGKTPSMDNKDFWEDGKHLWITSKDMKSQCLNISQMRISDTAVQEMTVFHPGTILMVNRSGILRRTLPLAILAADATINQDIKAIVPYLLCLSSYLYYAILAQESFILSEYKKAGTTVDNINFDKFISLLIPLPPQKEQDRIVSSLNQCFAIIENIDSGQKDLEISLDAAKARILELAIHGKLVPQVPSDEPAIELLKRINPDFTPSDNLHYEGVLPIGWSLTRLGDVIDIISGTSYHKSDIVQIKSGIRILRGGNIQNGKIVLRDDDVFVHERLSAMYLSPCRGDIALVASTGSSELIGKSAIAEIDYPNTQIGAFLRIIRPKAIELAEYLGVIFQSNYYKNHIRDVAKGTNINNIKSIYITDFVVPIPPIDEQRRILQHLKALFTIANQISDSIDESQ